MWGQVDLFLKIVYSLRIIPTRVGTSIHQDEATPHLQDHPHACGDKRRARAEALKQRRSSPRMWGQVDRHTCYLCCQRIIPTRVGTRHYPANLSKTAGDHPHACGDKSSLSFLAKEEQGSSPRVWGQVHI